MRDRRTRFPDISSSVPNTNQHGNTALHNNVPTPQYKPATYQLHIKEKKKKAKKKKKRLFNLKEIFRVKYFPSVESCSQG